MSKQTPSRDFHFEFEVNWGGTPSEVQKLEDWGKKQRGAVRWITLNFLLPWYAKWWLDYKLQREMASVDKQAENLVKQWDEEEEAKRKPIMESKPSEVEGLDDISLRYSWPAPDQWYQGPLEVFKETEEGFNTSAQPDTLSDPTLEGDSEEKKKK